MSQRPGRIIDEIASTCPDRDNPLKRRRERQGRRLRRAADGPARYRRAPATEAASRAGAGMMDADRASLVRRGTIASVVLLVVFLAAWEWGPGLLNIPHLHRAAAVDGRSRNSCACGSVNSLPFHTGITAFEVLVGFMLGSLLGALIGYVLGMSPTAEVRALALYPRAADRAEGRVRAAVHPVDGLHDLSEDPGRDPDRVLPGAWSTC